MLRPQTGQDLVQILYVAEIDLFLRIRIRVRRGASRSDVPSRLRPVPVVVPLQKRDVVLRHQLVQPGEGVLLHVVARQVQQQLVPRLRVLTIGKLHRPLRMRPVEIAVRVHHLRLHPDAEVHPQRTDAIDDRLEPMRKLLRVHIPVPQSGVVVLALAKPSVVDHKPLHPQLGRTLRQRHLPRLVHVELRRLPRVVDHRPRLRRGMRRQDLRQLKPMQHPRRLALSAGGVPRVKRRCLQRLPGTQCVRKIKRVVARGHANVVQPRVFDRHAPRARPAKLPEPHRPMRLRRFARAPDTEPRVRLVRRASAPALNHLRPRLDRRCVHLPLRAPLSRQPAQLVAGRLRQVPRGRGGLLHANRLLSLVLDPRPARQDPLRKHAVVEVHRDRLRGIMQNNLQRVGVHVRGSIGQN